MTPALMLFLALVTVATPLLYALRLWRLDAPGRIVWLIVAAESVCLVALVLTLGRWDIAGLWTRSLVALALAAALLRSALRHWRRPWRTDPATARRFWPSLLWLVVFAATLIHVGRGAAPDPSARDLAFPLAGGRFVVGHGGGVGLLNHHSGHPEQDHAVDIVAVGPLGFRARGPLPTALDAYRVQGASVVAPCAGRVVSTRDGLPEMTPPQRDAANPTGNQVTLACDGLDVVLAHLRPGSLRVDAGARVAVGDRLAEVGNSGNTTEPHLHVHAVDARTGAAAPIAFDGRAPIRGRVFERGPARLDGSGQAVYEGRTDPPR